MEWQNLKLTFWQTGDPERGTTDATAFATLVNTWYQKIQNWLRWPLQQFDLENAELFYVDLIAWERGVTRFKGEAENLYRLRVKYAYINAKDAGSTAGFKRIWQRLGLGDVEIHQRMDGIDWDYVFIDMPLEQTVGNERLLQLLINEYGRTCRRYAYASTATAENNIAAASMSAGTTVAQATATADFSDVITTDTGPLTINGELVRL